MTMRRVRREPAVTHKSKSNENKTRKNKLSTNCCWMLGKLRSGSSHLLVVAPHRLMSLALFALNSEHWRTEPGARVGRVEM